MCEDQRINYSMKDIHLYVVSHKGFISLTYVNSTSGVVVAIVSCFTLGVHHTVWIYHTVFIDNVQCLYWWYLILLYVTLLPC